MEEPSQWPVILVATSVAVHFAAVITDRPGVGLLALGGAVFGMGGLWFAG